MKSGAENLKLFRVVVPVRPATTHPIYYDWEFGLLTVFITDTAPESAVDRTTRIIQALPYELAGPVDALVQHAKDPDQIVKPVVRQALGLGIALQLDAAGIGVQKGDFFEKFFARENESAAETVGEGWKNAAAGDDNPQAT